MKYLIYSSLLATLLIIFHIQGSLASDEKIVSARIESCPGCSLNRLPEVKQFIYEDTPKYENVEFKKIHGAVPELVLLDDADKEIERLQLSSLTRKECNELLVKKGFKRKPEHAKEEF